MKALVLGATGQVGRALIRCAPPACEMRGIERSECSLEDESAVRRIVEEAGADVVFNAAAYTAVDRAETEHAVVMRINSEAAGVVAGAARRAGARMVHISTDFVFDGASGRPYKPTDPVAPLGAYGVSKAAGEVAVMNANRDSLVVRTAWVYAEQGANFVNTMLRLMGERSEVSVVCDQFGTPTYAGSLARALWQMVAREAQGIFHYTDSGVASWYDFAVAIEEEGRAAGLLARQVAVKPISTEQFPTPARRPGFSVLDNVATWKLLGAPAPHWRSNLRVALKEIASSG